MSKTITAQKLWESVLSGEITIDWRDHQPPYEYSSMERLNESIREELDRQVDRANGGNDNKWHKKPKGKEKAKKFNDEMSRIVQLGLDRTYQDGEVIQFMNICIKDVSCSCCGVRMLPHLDLSNKKLSYAFQHKRSPLRVEELEPCDMANKTEFTSTIDVSSPLVLINHFEELFPDEPKGQAYTDQWSLCNLKGRENITKHLEGQNVLYGQLSNTYATVYLSDDKSSIIIGEDWENDGKEGSGNHKGYTEIGSISCGVWRWMATDKNTVTQENLNKMKKNNPYMDVIELDVPHGQWKMSHYYDFGKNENLKKGIWAKIELC